MPRTALKVKLLRPGARVPSRATSGASGLDLYACLEGDVELTQNLTLVPTGIAFEVPPGYDLQIRPRSGLAKRGVDVILGTVDSDYRGEIFVGMRTFGSLQAYPIHHGDRIAQLVVTRVEQLPLLEVDELAQSERGDGGYGSTGR